MQCWHTVKAYFLHDGHSLFIYSAKKDAHTFAEYDTPRPRKYADVACQARVRVLGQRARD